jgi:hypothetical protein
MTAAYVTVRRENKVKVLDLTGSCPVLTGREAIVGTQPDTLQLTNDGRTLVVTLRGTPAQISLLDIESFGATIVNIPGHTTTGHHWLSASGKYSFVAVEGPAGVVVVDNETGATLADYPYPTPARRQSCPWCLLRSGKRTMMRSYRYDVVIGSFEPLLRPGKALMISASRSH